jgi:hypothetical protein
VTWGLDRFLEADLYGDDAEWMFQQLAVGGGCLFPLKGLFAQSERDDSRSPSRMTTRNAKAKQPQGEVKATAHTAATCGS